MLLHAHEAGSHSLPLMDDVSPNLPWLPLVKNKCSANGTVLIAYM